MLLQILAVASSLVAQCPLAEVADSAAPRKLQWSGLTATTTTRCQECETPTCGSGWALDLVHWTCRLCYPGRASNGTAQGNNTDEAKICPACPAGKFAEGAEQASCTDCDGGKFASGRGNAVCRTCAAGKTPSASSAGCDPCPAGRHGGSSGGRSSGFCAWCDVGRYSSRIGAVDISACQACAPGSFAAESGRSACDACSPGRYRFASEPADSCSGCSRDMDPATYPTCAIPGPEPTESNDAVSGVVISACLIAGICLMWFSYSFCFRLANIAEYSKIGKERQESDVGAGTEAHPDKTPLPSGTWICSYQRRQCFFCWSDYSAKLFLEFRSSGEVTGKCEDADGEHMMVGSYDLKMQTVKLAILYRWGGIEVSTHFGGEKERAEEVLLEGYFITVVGTEGRLQIRFEPDSDHVIPKKPLKRPSLIDSALGSAADTLLKKSGTSESIARLSQRRSSRQGSSAGLNERRNSRTSRDSRLSYTTQMINLITQAQGPEKDKKKNETQAEKEKEARPEEEKPPYASPEASTSAPVAPKDVEMAMDLEEEAPGEAYQKPLDSRSAHPSKSHLPAIKEEDMPEVPGSRNVGAGYQVYVNSMQRSADDANGKNEVAIYDWEETPEPPVRQTTDDTGNSKACCRSLLCVPEVNRADSGPMP